MSNFLISSYFTISEYTNSFFLGSSFGALALEVFPPLILPVGVFLFATSFDGVSILVALLIL